MKWLTRLFGYSGRVRFEGISTDGHKYTGKMNIEAVGIDGDELKDCIKNIIFVERGVRLKSINILGYYETQ